MASVEVADGFTLSGVGLRRASRPVFSGLDFRIAPGEIHALVGARNVGKSTLCALLAGEVRPDAGDVGPAAPETVAKVTDVAAVFPDMTVGNNLILGKEPSWLRWLDLKHVRLHRLRRWLDQNGIDLPLDWPLRTLPKEDWLFVQILNRLYQAPALLILDEALEGLSQTRFRQLWPLLESARDQGMSILWVTNTMESALVLADRVSVLRDGRILLSESARRLDRLSLIALCYGFLERSENEPSAEQFHQMMWFTETLLRDLPNAVFITDMQHRVRFINQSGNALFGLPAAWPGDSRLEDILGRGNARLAELIRTCGGDRDEWEWHSLPIRVEEDKRLVDVRMRLVREGETPVGFMLVMEDVSQREEMRQRLTLSENLASVGLLAAGVAHEVNNPLEVMENYLNYLGETETGEERRDIIGQVTRETRNIRETVQQLVAFSGHRDGRRIKTDMARLADQLCSLLHYQVRMKGIEFQCRTPERRVLVAAAPNEMRQLLLNLLRNAIDAMPRGGVIRIGMEVVEETADSAVLELTVEDEGIGIEAERIDDIFLPFVSSKGGQDSHQGLGLSIVYAIVENCGGGISVENRAEGGCRFTLRLPCLFG